LAAILSPEKALINTEQVRLQCVQLQDKVKATKSSLASSDSLSQIINAGISSLEVRKRQAIDTSNLFEDVLSVRKEIQAVQTPAAPLEQRTLNMARGMSIMTSLEPRGVI
jgi:hypothetical protein